MIIFEKDSNGRKISLHHYKNVFINGNYPNVNVSFNPIDETVMSLKNVKSNIITESNPVFFFMYNMDNYYHFIYDTLPYIRLYNQIKSYIDIKILIQKPKYRFVTEFLNIVIPQHKFIDSDFLYFNSNIRYDNLYVADSMTHGIDSNLPPHDEARKFFNIIRILNEKLWLLPKMYEKIYISRRSHIHGRTDNIGTNYTTRRQMTNEDELVEYLTSKGYKEIFTENMTIKDVLSIFYHAKSIIGPIGGGMANCLFCQPGTEVIPIISPTFLDVNKRFEYCFDNLDYKPFYETEHVEKDDFKKYMRVQTDTFVGEIININGDFLEISFSEKPVSGWNANTTYRTKIVHKNECTKLDNGLNSVWKINLDKFKEIV